MNVSHLSSLILSLAIAACGGASSSSAARPATPAATDPSCPVAVAGTSVNVEDSPSGASLVFVTTGDVADVRRRVAAMASKHNEHLAAMGPMPDGKDAGGGHAGHDMSGHAGHDMSGHAGHDMSGKEGHASGGSHAGHAGGMIGVHSKATTSDVEGGAKIEFVVGAADVAKIQAELRMHAQHFASGTCEMGKS